MSSGSSLWFILKYQLFHWFPCHFVRTFLVPRGWILLTVCSPDHLLSPKQVKLFHSLSLISHQPPDISFKNITFDRKNPSRNLPPLETAVGSKSWKRTWNTDQMWGTWGTTVFDAFVQSCFPVQAYSMGSFWKHETKISWENFGVCSSVFNPSFSPPPQPMLAAANAWDHFSHHNKEKTSHYSKVAL